MSSLLVLSGFADFFWGGLCRLFFCYFFFSNLIFVSRFSSKIELPIWTAVDFQLAEPWFSCHGVKGLDHEGVPKNFSAISVLIL